MDDRIREEAYAIWCREGRPVGREREHWFAAAANIRERDHEASLNVPSPVAELLSDLPHAASKAARGQERALQIDVSMMWVLAQRFHEPGVDELALSLQFCDLARRVFEAVEHGHPAGRQGYASEMGYRAVTRYLDEIKTGAIDPAAAEHQRDGILTLVEVALSTCTPYRSRRVSKPPAEMRIPNTAFLSAPAPANRHRAPS